MNEIPIHRRAANEIVAVKCYNRVSEFYRNEAANIVRAIQAKFLNRKVRKVSCTPTKELSDFLKSLDIPNMKWISASVQFNLMRVEVTFEILEEFNLVEDVWDHKEKKHYKNHFVAGESHRCEASIYIGVMQGCELVEVKDPNGYIDRDEMTVELMHKLIKEHDDCKSRMHAIDHQLTGICKFK
jgi:hypothetical protein